MNFSRALLTSKLPRTLNTFTRTFSATAFNMGVTKQQISPGDGQTRPKQGDTITMSYVGTLENGTEFDSTTNRGDFQTRIGVGAVIRGWDEGILTTDGGMTLGEKAKLTITGDYAYGERGFPNVIPPNATLIFELQLKAINGQRAQGL